MMTISDLEQRIGHYLPADQVEKVRRAYEFGALAHEGQRRKSGEPYIHHPLEVAGILGDMRMDYQTLAAAMLHDVIEDTDTVKQELVREFGKGVAELVDGVSKLPRVEFDSHEETQARNFQKMLMAMSNDIRVIIVKLADRLHNMRTLGALEPEKRRRIARETLEIYAPIAQRLGINSIRLELEELGFAALYPMRHRVLKQELGKTRGNRKEVVNKIKNALKRRLRQEKIPAQVMGREKHLYGIYQKMLDKELSFKEVHDVYAFRIIVDNVDTCYRVVGAVHNLYSPAPGKFKDYVAIPKSNGYQSLHTVLLGPHGAPLEVQIRTGEMNEVAEVGVAAHWLYKSSSAGARAAGAHKRAREWLRHIMEMQSAVGNPRDFLEHVKIDLFPESVYAFTPRGDIIELQKNATAVDFAYAIHTDVGNSCVGVRIDQRLAPLSTRLSSGQTVDVIRARQARPDPAWLNFAVTAKARANIRHFLRGLRRTEAVTLGKRLLMRELERYSSSYDQIKPAQWRRLLKEFQLKRRDELLQEVGLGNRVAPVVARQLMGDADGAAAAQDAPLAIKGTEGMVVSFPKCCLPIPGDPIRGFVTAGRGIIVHYQDCPNVTEFRNHPDKWINVAWEKQIDSSFLTRIKVNATNQRGVLARIAAEMATREANIISVKTQDKDDQYTTLDFVVEITDRQHLADIMRGIRSMPHIARISRR